MALYKRLERRVFVQRPYFPSALPANAVGFFGSPVRLEYQWNKGVLSDSVVGYNPPVCGLSYKE